MESNPGRVTEQSKRDCLAGLIREPPEKVGNALMVWDSVHLIILVSEGFMQHFITLSAFFLVEKDKIMPFITATTLAQLQGSPCTPP